MNLLKQIITLFLLLTPFSFTMGNGYAIESKSSKIEEYRKIGIDLEVKESSSGNFYLFGTEYYKLLNDLKIKRSNLVKQKLLSCEFKGTNKEVGQCVISIFKDQNILSSSVEVKSMLTCPSYFGITKGDIIELNSCYNKGDILLLTIHEIGHILRNQDRIKIDSFLKTKVKQLGSKIYLTQYSKKNIAELHSELFSIYINKPSDIKKLDLGIYNYFKNNYGIGFDLNINYGKKYSFEL